MWKFALSNINTILNTIVTIFSTFFSFDFFMNGLVIFGIVFGLVAILFMIRFILGWLKTVNPTPPPPEPPKTFWPPYLFYLPNREEQTAKLGKAINEHEQTGVKQRPLVCLVGGESQEAHDKFKDCFVDKTLPKVYPDEINIKNRVEIELRMYNCSRDRAKLQDDIFNELILNLPHYPPENTKAGVAQFLAEHGLPVIVYIDIFIKSCQPVNNIIEKGFIEFWRDWPAPQADYFINQEDKPHYRLLVFMCFHYPDTTQRRFQFTNPLSKPSRIRRKVIRQLNRLDKQLSRSICCFEMGTVILPQLESVKEVDTIKWLWGDCKNHITFGYDTLKEMEAKIRQFYEGHSHGIPMETLAPQLQKILQETTT
ncbi:MAG: hypothetical protein VSS75_006085 [Candidatus Parabeggiatoa sp.]|nr:hypothetical protein [Candidatus Parabeggiatoa sp.]